MNNRIVDQASVYTDVNAVQKLRGKNVDKDEAIRATSRQFESFMTSMMLKSMRAVNAVFEEGNPFHDNASQVYRDMLDQQLSINLSNQRGMGLADMLARQLGARDATQSEVALSQEEKTALSRVSAHRLGRPLLASQIEGPVQPASLSEKLNLRHAGIRDRSDARHEGISLPSRPVQAPLSRAQSLETAVPDSFESPEAYIDHVYPAAARVAEKLGVDPAVLVAQSALETGWGKHMIRHSNGEPSYNLFGIKADKRWNGEVATVSTTEYVNGRAVKEMAPFRAYTSFEDSFTDYLQFVKNQPRYEHAVASAEDPKAYLQALQNAGYATDPAYARKIEQIYQSEAVQRARIDWMSRNENAGESSL
jgi:flagellar protein FlgJ